MSYSLMTWWSILGGDQPLSGWASGTLMETTGPSSARYFPQSPKASLPRPSAPPLPVRVGAPG
ncbi:MAG: hypothetical protein WBW80_08915, partial [Acidimicrobiales bacterium]